MQSAKESFEAKIIRNGSIYKLGIAKKPIHLLLKQAYIYKLFVDHKLAATQQLFSWTSAGLSKCQIDEVIGSQDHMTVLAAP